MKLNKILLDSLKDATGPMDVKMKADALGMEVSPEDAAQLWSIIKSGVSVEELCSKLGSKEGINKLSYNCNPFTYCAEIL